MGLPPEGSGRVGRRARARFRLPDGWKIGSDDQVWVISTARSANPGASHSRNSSAASTSRSFPRHRSISICRLGFLLGCNWTAGARRVLHMPATFIAGVLTGTDVSEIWQSSKARIGAAGRRCEAAPARRVVEQAAPPEGADGHCEHAIMHSGLRTTHRAAKMADSLRTCCRGGRGALTESNLFEAGRLGSPDALPSALRHGYGRFSDHCD